METHPKKRLEIIVERPILRRVLDLLDELDVPGYTVLPALAGRGRRGKWRREGMVGEAGQMVAITCVMDESRIDAVLGPVFKLVSRQIGIVTVSDVEVIRQEHF